MARETKIAMLIGLGVILLIGIIISDHLATVQVAGGGSIDEFAQRSERALGEPSNAEQARQDAELAAGRVAAELDRPIPSPEELEGQADDPPPGAYDAPPPRDLRAMRVHHGGDAHTRFRSDANAPPPSLEFSRTARELANADDSPSDPAPRANAALSATRSEAQRSPAHEEPEPATATPTPTRDRTTDAGGQVVHYLGEGETLYDVARRYLGDGELWPALVAANRSAIADPDRVSPGLRLVIPPTAHAADVTAAAASRSDRAEASRSAAAQRSKTVVVQSGDTLSGIAGAYLGDADRWREILELNDLKRATDLREGMEIKLPPLAGSADRGAEPARDAAPRRYVVKRGDTLAAIAERTLGDADRWEELYRANRDELDDPDAIRVGQTLSLPR